MVEIFKNEALKFNWNLIRNPTDLENYFKSADLSELVVDTESTGLDYYSTLLGVSLYDGKSSPVFAAPKTKYWESEIKDSDFRDIFNEYLPKAEIIAHNAKYDRGVFKVRDYFHTWNLKDDTSLLIHAYDPDMKKQLEYRVNEDFGYAKKKFDVLVSEKLGSKRKISWDKVQWNEDILKLLAEYSCEDVYWEYRIWQKYLKLCIEANVMDSYENIEKPLVFTLSDMETRGIRVDTKFLYDLEVRCLEDKQKLESEVHSDSGFIFNLNSPKQLADVIYKQMGLPVLKYTAKGAPSTDGDTLKELARQGYPIATKLVAHSELDTLLGSFVSKIPTMVDKQNILRCSFNQDITRTGRLSSSNPNLQNQPNNAEYPVRQAYIPRDGYTFLVLDYSQIEPRIMAHYSQDPKMLKVFNEGSDIYTGIATELSITRSEAKVVQLAISYGMGPDKLQAMLGSTLDYAKQKMEEYKRTYKVYFSWKHGVEKEAEKNGYVTTMFGSRRLLPDIKSANRGIYYSALRKAINTPIQGSAAQIIKIAMNNLRQGFVKKGIDAHILLSVHDELVIEIKTEIIESLVERIIRTVETSVTLDVPILAEYKICSDWSQMKSKTFAGLTTEDLAIRMSEVKKFMSPCLTVPQMLACGLI